MYHLCGVGGDQALGSSPLLVFQMSALDQLLAYDFEADQEFEVSMPAQ